MSRTPTSRVRAPRSGCRRVRSRSTARPRPGWPPSSTCSVTPTSGSAPRKTRCECTGRRRCTSTCRGSARIRRGRARGSRRLRCDPCSPGATPKEIPAYLESTKERNVGFYEGHGFAVVGREQIPLGGPPLWLMWRDAEVVRVGVVPRVSRERPGSRRRRIAPARRDRTAHASRGSPIAHPRRRTRSPCRPSPARCPTTLPASRSWTCGRIGA